MTEKQEAQLRALIEEARNKNATPANVQEIVAFVRALCDENYGAGNLMARRLMRLRLGLSVPSDMTD